MSAIGRITAGTCRDESSILIASLIFETSSVENEHSFLNFRNKTTLSSPIEFRCPTHTQSSTSLKRSTNKIRMH